VRRLSSCGNYGDPRTDAECACWTITYREFGNREKISAAKGPRNRLQVYDCQPAMRACVTGAADFIGRALVRRLLRRGLSVRALLQPSEHANNLRTLGIEIGER